MNNKWEQYKASNSKKSNKDKWAQYHSSNFKTDNEDKQESPMQQNNPEESKGWSGVAQDIGHKGWEYAKGLPEALMNLPGEVYGAAKQIGEPSRIAKNLGAGLGHLGHNILSGAGNLRDYLVKKDIASKESPSYRFPENIIPKDFNYEQGVGLEGHKAGDELLQGLPTGLVLTPLAELAPNIPGLRSGKRHEQALSKAIEQAEKTKQSHLETLGEGQKHGNHISQELISKVEKNREEIGNEFNALDEKFSGKKVQMPLEPSQKQINRLLQIANKNAKADIAGNPVSLNSFKKQAEEFLTQGNKSKMVDAQSLYRKYRTLTIQAAKDNAKAYTHNIDPDTHHKWIGISAAKEAEAQRIENLLKKVNPEAIEELSKTKKRWREEYVPLRKNPLYNEMLEHTRTTKNVMEFLSGTTPGNDILNSIVSKSPKLQKNIVGQQYAAKPSKLAQKNELLDPYAKMNPEISKIIEEQKKIQHFEKNEKPKLEEEIKKSRERKIGRRGFAKGVAATGLTGATALAIDAGLGRDWKNDIPLLAALLKKGRSK